MRPTLALLICPLLWLWPPPASAQEEVEELLDEIRALSRGLSLGGDEGDLSAVVQAELPAVEAAAGMKATAPIGTRVVTREQARAHVAGLLAAQVPPQKLAAMEVAWKALGLMAPDASLGPAIERLYADQAGGFYDPSTGSMVLLGDMPMLFQVPVVRHELVHALQDQRWHLAEWLGDAGEDEDRSAAVQAVLEGHATDVMNRVTLGAMGLGDAMDPARAKDLAELLGTDPAGLADLTGGALDASSLGAFLPADTPAVLRQQLLFPYVVGEAFVAGYRRAHPGDPGCQALYRRPPRTTAEVLNPTLWESGTFRPDYGNPGILVPGYSVAWTSSLGRLISWILLTGEADASAGDPDGGRWGIPTRDRSVVLGSGWRGDRVAVLTPDPTESGSKVPAGHAVAWIGRWRDPREAKAVAAALKSRLPEADVRILGARVAAVIGPRGTIEGIQQAMTGW